MRVQIYYKFVIFKNYSLSILSCCIWFPFSWVITNSVMRNFSPPALRLPMAYVRGALPLLCRIEKDLGV
jgi:TRAP-type C4-dicarboxylate transport system permease small subunit